MIIISFILFYVISICVMIWIRWWTLYILYFGWYWNYWRQHKYFVLVSFLLCRSKHETVREWSIPAKYTEMKMSKTPKFFLKYFPFQQISASESSSLFVVGIMILSLIRVIHFVRKEFNFQQNILWFFSNIKHCLNILKHIMTMRAMEFIKTCSFSFTCAKSYLINKCKNDVFNNNAWIFVIFRP